MKSSIINIANKIAQVELTPSMIDTSNVPLDNDGIFGSIWVRLLKKIQGPVLIICILLLIAIIYSKIRNKKTNKIVNICFIISVIIFICIKLALYYY